MQDDAENIVKAVLTAARNGDMTAAKIILDRLVPVRRAVSFDLPKIECKADVVPANAAILAAIADGEAWWPLAALIRLERRRKVRPIERAWIFCCKKHKIIQCFNASAWRRGGDSNPR
jgi:hypothetical protein